MVLERRADLFGSRWRCEDGNGEKGWFDYLVIWMIWWFPDWLVISWFDDFMISRTCFWFLIFFCFWGHLGCVYFWDIFAPQQACTCVAYTTNTASWNRVAREGGIILASLRENFLIYILFSQLTWNLKVFPSQKGETCRKPHFFLGGCAIIGYQRSSKTCCLKSEFLRCRCHRCHKFQPSRRSRTDKGWLFWLNWVHISENYWGLCVIQSPSKNMLI